jgi:ubiquitin C-terminal hydrolase
MLAFGLRNTGTVCHFNSLIQGLISCPHFVKTINEKCESDIANTISDFLSDCKKSDIKILTVVPILKHIIESHPTFGRQQEDVSEGFDILIDSIGPSIESIFTSKWKIYVYCDACKNIVSTTTDTMNRLIMEESYNSLYENDTPFQDYMSANMSEFNDYKCGNCNRSNVNGMKITQLIEPPDIYIVSFNKFNSKWGMEYPKVVNVKYGINNEHVAKYCIVAIIRHFGNKGGGHYNATVARSNGVHIVDDSICTISEFKPSNNDYMVIFIRI